jgi:hypothetical protein
MMARAVPAILSLRRLAPELLGACLALIVMSRVLGWDLLFWIQPRLSLPATMTSSLFFTRMAWLPEAYPQRHCVSLAKLQSKPFAVLSATQLFISSGRSRNEVHAGRVQTAYSLLPVIDGTSLTDSVRFVRPLNDLTTNADRLGAADAPVVLLRRGQPFTVLGPHADSARQPASEASSRRRLQEFGVDSLVFRNGTNLVCELVQMVQSSDTLLALARPEAFRGSLPSQDAEIFTAGLTTTAGHAQQVLGVRWKMIQPGEVVVFTFRSR